uniref:Ig-like domain-containing protein n=1 Tax=Seriola lalandi dorsalis TaxID=1841481 RepID=A0A3B4XCS1_SERLL
PFSFPLLLLLFLVDTEIATVRLEPVQLSVSPTCTGDNATIHCNHTKGINYFQMYWYRQVPGENIKLIVFTTTAKPDHDFGDFDKKKFSATKPDAESGTFTVENLEPGDQGLYFCAVSQHSDTDTCGTYFGGGTKLTVLDPKREITPPTVKVFQPSSKECRNLKDEKERKKTLLCVARDFYPDHVSIFWQVNAKNVTKGVATDPAARLDDKTYFITSRLRVHAEVWTSPGTNFSCFVTFFDGNKTIIKDETVFAVEGMFMWNSEIT